jgi:hypothetical protein
VDYSEAVSGSTTEPTTKKLTDLRVFLSAQRIYVLRFVVQGLRSAFLSRRKGSQKMTSSSLGAKTFRVHFEQDGALYMGTSPELKGLLVVGYSREEVEAKVPAAVQDLFAACDVYVVVSRVDEAAAESTPWVAVPAEVARRGLERVA